MSSYCRRFKATWHAGWQKAETAKWHRARSRALLLIAQRDATNK